jgi:opacity protein-like surface antigen
MGRGRPAALPAFVCSLLIALLVPAQGAAQDQPRAPAPPAGTSAPDFFFTPPVGSLGLRGNWVFARAGSDIFGFLTRQLTLDRGDFRAPGLAADLGIAISPRLDVVVGFEFASVSPASEYRDYVDNNRQPIEQTTRLSTMHLTGSVRYALTPRGQAVGRLAWVPRRVVPYVGAGGGLAWHRFAQRGDFVDFVDLSVFQDSFTSSGWSPAALGYAGVDLQLYRRLFAAIEGRYVWSSATLGRDFVDFDPIDLAGFRTSVGISVLF